MTTEFTAEEFADAISIEMAKYGNDAATERFVQSGPEVRAAGTDIFLGDVLNRIADHNFRQPNRTFLDAARQLLDRLAAGNESTHPDARDFVAVVVLTATLLEKRFSLASQAQHDETDDECRNLFETTSISFAIRELYMPRDGNTIESRQWNLLDFPSLRYHKSGTTSVILTGTRTDPDDESGARIRLAIKCVLYPWNKLAAIASATDAYAQQYGAAHTPPAVVRPIASSPRWIIMRFVTGRTLGEDLIAFEKTKGLTFGARVDKARDVASAVTKVMHSLARGRPVAAAGDPATQHLDLSPNNIMFDTENDQLVLIDLGRNHLYSRQIGIPEHDDSVYISPEVKNRADQTQGADFYSLGIVLIQILAGYPPRDGHVPDKIWQGSPDVGRVLEDLIEEQYQRRLILRPPAERWSFESLGRSLETVFQRAADEPGSSKSGLKRALALLAPASREVSAQFKQWRLSHNSEELSVRHDSYLLLFAVIATSTWWFIAARTALVKLDDVVTLKVSAFPTGIELAASIIAFSQGVVAAKYYQTILARLRVVGLGGSLALATEISMRLMTIIALITTIMAVFWRPELWAWACAIGAVGVSVANFLTITLANRIIDVAEGELSSATSRSKVSSHGYEQWWWTMLLYAFVIAVIALGLQNHFLQDMPAYVFGLCLITFGIHYISKCVIAGPAIRGELARAYSIGERLALLHGRGELVTANWPPRIIPRR